MNWDFHRHSWWLQRTQWYTPGRLRALQERRLRHLVTHAYRQVPFYRRTLEDRGIHPADIRSLDDLPLLPVLPRRAVAEDFAALVARDAARFRPERGSTSGTSGTSLEFLRDRRTLSVGNAALWRFRAWHGIRPGARIAEVRGGIWRAPSGEPDLTSVSAYIPALNTLRLNLQAPDPRRRAAVTEALAGFRPELIRGSSVLLTYLSMYLLEHPEVAIRPRVVFAGGERLFPEQRRTIAEAFRAPVVESYGNWEYAVFAGECEEGRLHLAAEMGILEVVSSGARCPPGETGEVIVTSLWNHSLPFIRYAIGDVGLLEGIPCPCGRGLPTWRVLGGRDKDLLATPGGYIYLTTDLVATPRWRGKIDGIRFYQDARNEVLVQVVRGPAFAERDLEILYAELNEFLGGLLRISFEFVENLELTAGGKFRHIVSRIPNEK